MSKTLTYSGFVIASILMVLVFVTAKTYPQLTIAVVLYPLLAYFALKLFPRKNPKAPVFTTKIPARSVQKVEEVKREKVDVADIDKRIFLKLVGTAGISFFLFSLLGRRVESLLFGRAIDSGTNSIGTIPAGQTESLPTEGYRITEVDDGVIAFYGFTNKDSSWLIMRGDTEAGSFRYVRGKSNFPGNWNSRENLKYDYYHNLF